MNFRSNGHSWEKRERINRDGPRDEVMTRRSRKRATISVEGNRR